MNSLYLCNFNGTSHDVDVLTHEAGHAFPNIFFNVIIFPSSQRWPGMEGRRNSFHEYGSFCVAMGKDFFKEDAEKKILTLHHLSGANFILTLWCTWWMNFQHEVYPKNHILTPDERKALWRRLEKVYLPSLKIMDDDHLWKKELIGLDKDIFLVLPHSIILDYTLSSSLCFPILGLKIEENP